MKLQKDILLTTQELLNSNSGSYRVSKYNTTPTNEIDYYKGLITQMNNEIGDLNTRLTQIGHSNTASIVSEADYSSQRANQQTYSYESKPDDYNYNFRTGYNLSNEKDKKLLQLAENKKLLINKNKELERQLNQLEKMTSGFGLSFDIKNDAKKKKASKSKTKKGVRSNSVKNKTTRATRYYGTHSRNTETKGDLKAMIEDIKEMVNADEDKETICDKLTALQSYVNTLLKGANANSNKVMLDKAQKRIEKLEKENRDLKDKVTKIRQITK